MKAVVTRVSRSEVVIDGKTFSSIGQGFLILLGIHEDDTESDAEYMVKKLCGLRVFEDEAGKMNLSCKQVGGEMLVVSNFTLYGDARSGNRPSFIHAARPERAIPLYEFVIDRLRENAFTVKTGKFGADMKLSSVNDGPVTIIIETSEDK